MLWLCARRREEHIAPEEGEVRAGLPKSYNRPDGCGSTQTRGFHLHYSRPWRRGRAKCVLVQGRQLAHHDGGIDHVQEQLGPKDWELIAREPLHTSPRPIPSAPPQALGHPGRGIDGLPGGWRRAYEYGAPAMLARLVALSSQQPESIRLTNIGGEQATRHHEV